jgi:hypothetical protein
MKNIYHILQSVSFWLVVQATPYREFAKLSNSAKNIAGKFEFYPMVLINIHRFNSQINSTISQLLSGCSQKLLFNFG